MPDEVKPDVAPSKPGELFAGDAPPPPNPLPRKKPATAYTLSPERIELWDRRVEVVRSCKDISKEDQDCLLKVFEGLALGGRFGLLLPELGHDWTWYNKLVFYHPQLAELHKVAVECCRLARKARLEDEAFRRAVEGVEEPIFDARGRRVGSRVRYSDSLLTLMLQANLPEVYAKTTEKAVAGGPMLVVNIGIRRDNPSSPAIDVSTTPAEKSEETRQ